MIWGILVDVSRSLKAFTGEERDVVLCLAEIVKEMIFDPGTWGIFAFDNNFYVVKDFSENYTDNVRARIGGLRNSGLTYLPDAIQLLTKVLSKRYEENKVIVVVSDGFPTGYEDVENELLKNVKEAFNQGIGVIGIGIKSRAIKKYFKINSIIETPYELMSKFAHSFYQYTAML
jgi:nitric oxide reductase activation protein